MDLEVSSESRRGPRVSVLMSVFDGCDHLAESVESILGQTFEDFEFVIVDDGSTDRSPQMLHEYAQRDTRVRVMTNPSNVGLTRSLNRGVGVVRGDLIARQDADDVSNPTRLADQVAYLDAHPEIGLLGTAYCFVDENGGHPRHQCPEPCDVDIRWRLLFDNPFCHASVMFRRALLAAAGGGYNEALPCAQDYELWVRFLKLTQAANLPQSLVLRRQHKQTITERRGLEQATIAEDVAAEQMERLMGRAPSRDVVRRLRRWQGSFPALLGPAEIEDCRNLVALIRAFIVQNGRNDRTCAIKRVWAAKIMISIPDYRLRLTFQGGLLRDLFLLSPGILVCNLIARLRRRVLRGTRVAQ